VGLERVVGQVDESLVGGAQDLHVRFLGVMISTRWRSSPTSTRPSKWAGGERPPGVALVGRPGGKAGT
jgi:hypothetical protein